MTSQGLLAESDPLIEEGPVYEGVGLAIFDYLEFWDLEGLQTWAETHAGESVRAHGFKNDWLCGVGHLYPVRWSASFSGMDDESSLAEFSYQSAIAFIFP